MNDYDNETIVRIIQNGQCDRKEMLGLLWEKNIGLVRKIVHELTGLERHSPTDIQDFEDMEQQAFIGIMIAIENYDSSTGIKFFTFATHYIRKSIYRYYDKNGQALRVPEYMRHRIRNYKKACDDLESQGKTVSDETARERMGISEKSFAEMQRAIQRLRTQSLDTQLQESDRDSGTVLDMIASDTNISEMVTASVYEQELHEILSDSLKELPDTERQIVTARFFYGMNSQRIATLMNCTRENIRQRLNSAYKRIRTGKYGKELATFLPERAAKREQLRITDEIETLTNEEKDLLI